MSFEDLERLRQSRDRLAMLAKVSELLARTEVADPPRRSLAFPGPVDLIVTLCELNDRHGTGVLIQRLFRGEPAMVTVRSREFYRGEQTFGALQTTIAHGNAERREVFAQVLGRLGGLDVRRILCIPYNSDDVLTGLAAKAAFGVPLCTWVMDDQNIAFSSIPDAPLRELFLRSNVRFAISPEMRAAYEAKFGLSFHLVPPVADAEFVLRRQSAPDSARIEERRGILLGNIWGERWLEGLLDTVRDSGVVLDWPSPGGTPWMSIDHDRLTQAGLRVRPFLPEAELVASLRVSPFVVVPSGTLEGEDSHVSVARLSLPSRIPYIAATAGTPIVLLGNPETAAARFVTRHGLGVVVPYDRRSFSEAVVALCEPEAQTRHRARAAALAPSLSSTGVRDWIWRSLDAGRPIDERWKEL
jgi:hypothetical protein